MLFAPLGLKETYLTAYSQYLDISSLYKNSDIWNVIWLIRMAGGKLQVGQTKLGKSYLHKIMEIINNENNLYC